MDCSDYRRLLSRQIDGEIDSAGLESLELHLAACERCRRAREEMLELSALHREIDERAPAPAMVDEIMAGIDESERRGWMGGFARAAVPIAAALVIALGIYTGTFIVEMMHRPVSADQYAVLELEYLDGYPPGSVGDLLLPSAEGGNDD